MPVDPNQLGSAPSPMAPGGSPFPPMGGPPMGIANIKKKRSKKGHSRGGKKRRTASKRKRY